MVTVKYWYDIGELELNITVKGHAGQAEKGKDIVCASASILLYTIAQFVMNMVEQGVVESEHIILGEGDAIVSCKCEDYDTFDEVRDAYDLIELGYAVLAKNFPQYVRLEALT